MISTKKCLICGTTKVKNPQKHWFAGPKCDLCYRKEQYNKPNSKKKKYEFAYRSKNKESIKEKTKIYVQNRVKSDINFKLKRTLRRRVTEAVKRFTKNGSAIKDLGCSVEQLKLYLESKFQPGMTWTNYGKWEIDHVVALCNFNLSNREQFLKACNYTNLQPLWKQDHRAKTLRDLSNV